MTSVLVANRQTPFSKPQLTKKQTLKTEKDRLYILALEFANCLTHSPGSTLWFYESWLLEAFEPETRRAYRDSDLVMFFAWRGKPSMLPAISAARFYRGVHQSITLKVHGERRPRRGEYPFMRGTCAMLTKPRTAWLRDKFIPAWLEAASDEAAS